MRFILDLIDCVEDCRNNVAETSKRVPKIKSKLLNKILDYVERFEAGVNGLNPNNWSEPGQEWYYL